MFPYYHKVKAFQEERYLSSHREAKPGSTRATGIPGWRTPRWKMQRPVLPAPAIGEAARTTNRVEPSVRRRVLTGALLAAVFGASIALLATTESGLQDTRSEQVLAGLVATEAERVSEEAGVTLPRDPAAVSGPATAARTVGVGQLIARNRDMNPFSDHERIVPLDSAARNWHPYPS